MKVMTLDIMISNELRQYITDHHLKFGDKLPSERELCELFSIQRLTLRSAMKILEEMGIIYVVPKIGYFVAKQRIIKNVNAIRLISEIIKDNASTYETKLFKFVEIEGDKYLCRETNLPLGTKFFEIKRLLIADHEPVCMDYCFIPVSLAPDLMDYKSSPENLNDILVDKYHFDFFRTTQRIRVIEAENSYRNALELSNNAHVALLSGCIYDDHNHIFAFTESYMKYERFSFELF